MASGRLETGSALGLLPPARVPYRWFLMLVAFHALAQTSHIAVLPPRRRRWLLTRPYRRGFVPHQPGQFQPLGFPDSRRQSLSDLARPIALALETTSISKPNGNGPLLFRETCAAAVGGNLRVPSTPIAAAAEREPGRHQRRNTTLSSGTGVSSSGGITVSFGSASQSGSLVSMSPAWVIHVAGE